MGEINKYFSISADVPLFGQKDNRISVHFNDYRFRKAEEQSNLEPVKQEKIIEYVNYFLEQIGVDRVEYPKANPSDIDYEKIKQDNKLKDVRDIVWMKFTKDGYLGVVATSNDINFDIPDSKGSYNKKIQKYDPYHKKSKLVWKHNTSGIIVHHVNKKWDEDVVLVFPLKDIDSKYKRSDIEQGIGNYLIDKGVPILDYYSHNY